MPAPHVPALFTLDGIKVRKRDKLILSGITASIGAGRCTAVVGPSGAGKTTLLRLLTRLERPTEGHLTHDGVSLDEYDVLQLRRRVQFVAQQAVVLTNTVFDELRVGAPHLTKAEAADLLERAALAPQRFLRSGTAGLSGGEAQRLCLARAFALRPAALVLDEPTSALDAGAAKAIVATLRDFVTKDGGSVVLVSHDEQAVAELADDRLTLHRGRPA